MTNPLKIKRPFVGDVLTSEFVKKLLADGIVVDGRTGGILIGAEHDVPDDPEIAGGIMVIQKEGDKFVIKKEFEGLEYLLNSFAAQENAKFQEEINNPDDHYDFVDYEIPVGIKTIDLTLNDKEYKMKSKILFVDSVIGVSLTNRGSTKKHLDLLDDMNKKDGPSIYPPIFTTSTK